mgnify:CR=1 FL=1
MALLTRPHLSDGRYRSGLDLPKDLAWTEQQIADSLTQTLAVRPPGPIWIMADGSLMWNPLIAIEAEQIATLDGWHRSFCLNSIGGRGSSDHLGRVLSLPPGGKVQSGALRLPEATALADLLLLWTREMPSGAYRPIWAPATLADGRQVSAITFVANLTHPLNEADDSPATVARLVAVAVRAFGPNIDYVRALAQALDERGLRDDYVSEIWDRLSGDDGGGTLLRR